MNQKIKINDTLNTFPAHTQQAFCIHTAFAGYYWTFGFTLAFLFHKWIIKKKMDVNKNTQ